MKGKATTNQMADGIRAATDIFKFLKNNKENFISNDLSNCLNDFLLRKELKIADVVRGSQIDRAYVYQIFDGRKKPSRDKLIAIAFGLKLSDEETQNLLKLSGNRELYAKDRRDAVILFALQKGKDIMETDDLLYQSGCRTLHEPD